MNRYNGAASIVCVFGILVATASILGQESSAARVERRMREESEAKGRPRQLLYVAVPGAGANESGVGVLVFNAGDKFQFEKRLPTWDHPVSRGAEPVKGIAANPATGMLYIATTGRVGAFDLKTERKVWDETWEGECCDRLALSPDGKVLYAPSFGARDDWYVVDALTGKMITKIATPRDFRVHNTVFAPDGSRVFMAGTGSEFLWVGNPKTHQVVQKLGPFSNGIKPLTVNSTGTLVYVNVYGLLGFEIGDTKTGKMIHRVEVKGYGWAEGRPMGHGVPSHGVGLTPDEKEVWVTDGVNHYMHVFDNTVMPPKQKTSIETRTAPEWITFSIDGKYAYPSSGEVIDVATKKIVATLKDEYGHDVKSEKMLEVVFVDGKPVRAGDQMGVGRVGLSGSTN